MPGGIKQFLDVKNWERVSFKSHNRCLVISNNMNMFMSEVSNLSKIIIYTLITWWCQTMNMIMSELSKVMIDISITSPTSAAEGRVVTPSSHL